MLGAPIESNTIIQSYNKTFELRQLLPLSKHTQIFPIYQGGSMISTKVGRAVMTLPPSRKFHAFSDLYVTPPNAMKDTAQSACSWPPISDTQVSKEEKAGQPDRATFDLRPRHQFQLS